MTIVFDSDCARYCNVGICEREVTRRRDKELDTALPLRPCGRILGESGYRKVEVRCRGS